MLGIYYAFLAVGLNVVFGAQRIINLAHGDVVMLGGYAAWELFYTFKLSPILSTFVVMGGGLLFGLALYYIFIPSLARSQDQEMLSLILFFGLSQVIEAIASGVFGSAERSLPSSSIPSAPLSFLGNKFPANWYMSAGIALPIFVTFLLVLYRTSIGLKIRAFVSDLNEALVAGINSSTVPALYFAIGIALAAAAGVWGLFIFGGTSPTEGATLTATSFAIIVFGSLGNPVGTLIAGVIYGVIYQLTQVYAPSWSNLVPYLLVLVTMMLRPQGILGKAQRVA